MSQSYEFYMERANAADIEAGEAVLDNVRQKAERSAAAWRVLANQARNVQAKRDAAAKAKAQQNVTAESLN